MTTYNGDNNANVYTGTDNPDIIYGNGGNDTLSGQGGADIISGGTENDTLDGGDGDDQLNGDDGNDMLFGQAGNDYLTGGAGTDLLDGGSGTDAALYLAALSAVSADLRIVGAQATGGGGTDTLVSIENVYGSAFADTLIGNQFANVLLGEGGNDSLQGQQGNDTLYGGDGNDTLLGQDGSDGLYGGNGDDLLDGGTDVDAALYLDATAAVAVDLRITGAQATGGGGTDTLISIENVYGSAFADSLSGNALANGLFGQDGNDVLHGFEGNDQLNGNAGDDSCYGDDGADMIHGSDGNDLLDGGAGLDLAYYADATGAITIDLRISGPQATGSSGNDTLVSIENLFGSNFGDHLIGNALANVIQGADGNDDIQGLEGDDSLFGQAGSDSLSGGDGSDALYGGDGDDLLDGGAGTDAAVYSDASSGVTVDLRIAGAQATGGGGNDTLVGIETLYGSSFADVLTGNMIANALFGGDGDDSLNGDGGADTLRGDYGNDILDGGAGGDTMYGGFGNDVCYVDDAGDVVNENAGEGADRVRAAISYVLTAGSEVETLETIASGAATAINLTGNAFGQTILGNAGSNVLTGGGGADYLAGAGGDDILVGNADASSTLQGGTGNDWFYISRTGDSVLELAGEGNDRILTSVNYTLSAGQEIETLSAVDPAATAAIGLTGNALAQAINGNAGANVLTGGGGADSLVGLGGDDILIGNADASSTLQGGTGDDWYYVSRTGDSIVELAGEGNDRIITSVSYTLSSGVEIETLLAANQSGTATINLIGNDFDQLIFGTNGANGLSGNGGADQLAGFGGDDIILGGEEADQLNGGAGHDVLNGGNGADLFVFADALGPTNVDTVQDFASGSDRIALDHTIFTGLSTGLLSSSAFATGTAAQDADDRIIYNQATGELWFDADGNGAGAALLFATLSGQPAIAASDFVVI
jgi:serralysin